MDPVITGAAANVASEAAKGIFHEVKRHMRYVFICKKNVDKFEEKLKSLIAKRTSVQQEVDAANRNGEKIKADVEHWRKTVDKVINEEDKRVKDLEEKAKNKCFIGLCPNLKSRYQLSRTAEDGAATVDDLIGQCQLNGVGYLDVPQAIVDASPNGFETFKSREKVFNDIMEAMKDATISMIGVYGMPGVGKTSLVNEVATQVQEVKLFDSVVTVTVAQTPDIQKIQENIAELLGLRLDDKSTDVRARRLHERLKKEKTVLVVLDDIWKRLDLREVGIPFGSQHKGCKILLTSRDQNVLSNEMDADKTFAIDDLDDEEAWDLFRKMAGADSVESAELRSTAIEVAKKCARLPLAIATVARALRNKGLFVWKDALRQLQKPSSRNFTGISADVYSAIELSYNHLENEELKQAFLLCSLLHRDASIEDLLKYAIGLGVIKGVDTMEEARNSLLTMVSKLKTSCLLLGSTNNEYFNVHDLVYDVAMLIASEDNYVFAPKEDVLKDWPDEETMKKCKMIHLGFSGITELPDELNCPHLVYFHVFGEYGVLSNLLRLEELYMMGTCIQWEVEGHANHRSNASLAELKNLSRLTALEVKILDVTAMSGGLFFEELQKLERYKILVGIEDSMWFEAYECEHEYSRTLLLSLSRTTYHLDNGIKMLLKKTEALYLVGDPCKDNLMIKYIFNDNGAADKIEFAELRYLSFRKLPHLISFCSEDKSASTSMPQHELPLFSERSTS
ncbi:PREDICTED: disease resistance protein RFL1 [Theobroma cacao]|uniref:Disease resistance protein RFL1 n=1 Tax=Theobroma cacao TaxID=3641 RepID=A0AB32WG70_THECC|nr:PREDICTED: disease resistance protein RFL1 [Theobroma cacao]